jgi:hypothetical protein
MASILTLVILSIVPTSLGQVAGSGNTTNDTSDETQSDGVFAPVTSTTIVNSSMVEQTTHIREVSDNKGVNPTPVLDWSQDGRFVLFAFSNYSRIDSWGPGMVHDSLALIDLENNNKIQTLDLEIRSASSEQYPNGYLLTMFQAKFSSSGDAIFILAGGSGRDPDNLWGPENIYRYDLKTGVIDQITNSSKVGWFDTARDANDTLVYVTYDRISHFYPQDNTELSSRLNDFMVANNFKPLDRLAISPDGRQVAFPTSEGIKQMNLQSGDVRTIIPRTCISSVAFSPNGELLIYSPTDERTCERGEQYVLRIASIEGNSQDGELVYMNNWGSLDTVVSPDGAYLASNTQGSDKRHAGEGDENDINPRIVTIQLARPVPEFSGMIVVTLASALIASIVILFSTKKFFSPLPNST